MLTLLAHHRHFFLHELRKWALDTTATSSAYHHTGGWLGLPLIEPLKCPAQLIARDSHCLIMTSSSHWPFSPWRLLLTPGRVCNSVRPGLRNTEDLWLTSVGPEAAGSPQSLPSHYRGPVEVRRLGGGSGGRYAACQCFLTSLLRSGFQDGKNASSTSFSKTDG